MDRLTERLAAEISEILRHDIIECNGSRVLMLSPKEDAVQLPDACVALVREAAHTYGGVLLRGFDALGSTGLERFAASFGEPLLAYEFGSTPRSKVDKGVYSSTEYPADQWIDQHNEQSYTLKWPASIFFYCDIAAESGGATPVADSREVYRRLDPVLRRTFAQKKIMYVRNYGNGLDLPWQRVFGTDDRGEVERFCRANQIDFEWLDDGGELLRTRQICQSELRHSVTSETVWFNQAHLFHVSSLPESVREALLEVVDEENLPRNTFFGDGTLIDPAMLDEIRAVYRETLLSFEWRNHDLMMLDNVLMSHGRAPFSGERRVLVAMAG